MNLLIVTFTKFVVGILKLFRQGSGTALPGLIAEKINPQILGEMIKTVPLRIVITGTNGKTTTQSILKSILTNSGSKVLNNAAGANLARGLISEFIKRSNILGALEFDIAVLEVEEATLPKIISQIDPHYIVVTNIYRDQLDAYGEIDTTQRYISESIKMCPNAKIVLNGDDPRVRVLGNGLVNDRIIAKIDSELAKEIIYEKGSREDLDETTDSSNLTAKNIRINDDLSSTFDIETTNKTLVKNLNLKVPGFFHIYNFLFAYSVAGDLGVDQVHITKSLAEFNSAFGRGEIIQKNNKNIRILLVKNPTALTLNLSLIKNIPQLNILLMINDKIADGKDVSWLWDSLVEVLQNSDIKNITISGTRCYDMALRLKYAFGDKYPIYIQEVTSKALGQALHSTDESSTLYVLPTYTAMLGVRKSLGLRLE